MSWLDKLVTVQRVAKRAGYDEGFAVSAGFVRQGARISFFLATSKADKELVRELKESHSSARERGKLPRGSNVKELRKPK